MNLSHSRNTFPVDVIGDAGRFDIIVQTVIQATFMRPKYQG
jgi:hypothetical protein